MLMAGLLIAIGIILTITVASIYSGSLYKVYWICASVVGVIAVFLTAVLYMGWKPGFLDKNPFSKTDEETAAVADVQESPKADVQTVRMDEADAGAADTADNPGMTDSSQNDGAENTAEQQSSDVTVTIPAVVANGMTLEEINLLVGDHLFQSYEINSDGSITYAIPDEEYEQMMGELKAELEQAFQEMCGSEDFPDFVSVQTNDDFTDFKVMMKPMEEYNPYEDYSNYGFYVCGYIYNILNRTEIDNVHVEYVNEESGEVISVVDSGAL